MTCGPIFLRVWVKKEFKTLKTNEITDDIVQKFIIGIYNLLGKALTVALADMNMKQLSDLLV